MDTDQFTTLIRDGRRHWADGRHARAVASIDEALALWRDSPYSDLPRNDAARRESERLSELRLDGLELQQEHRLNETVDFVTVADLIYLCASHPRRLSFRLQLARAQYLTGRQLEALRTLREAPRDLTDDPALTELTLFVLHHDPAVATFPSV